MILTSPNARNETGPADTLLVPAPTESDTQAFAGVLSEYGEPVPETAPETAVADAPQSDSPTLAPAQAIVAEVTVQVNSGNADLLMAGAIVELDSVDTPAGTQLPDEAGQTLPVLAQLVAATAVASPVHAVSSQVEEAKRPQSGVPTVALPGNAAAETVSGTPQVDVQAASTAALAQRTAEAADMPRSAQPSPVTTVAADTKTTVTAHVAPAHLTAQQGNTAATMLQERRDSARDGAVDPTAPNRAAGDLTMAVAVDTDSETGERRRATAVLAPVTSTDLAVRTMAEQNAISQREPQVAAAAPAVAMPMMASEDWAESLAPRLLQFGMTGGGRMTVQLHPAELGTMEVALEVDRDDVRVSFVVSQGNARELLDSHTPRLRDMLAAQGFENVEVDISGGRDEDAGEENERNAGASGQDVSPGDTSVDDAAAALTSAAAASDRLVDAYA